MSKTIVLETDQLIRLDGPRRSPSGRQRFARTTAVVWTVVALAVGCGGGDDSSVEGTYVHDEEGTVVLESGGEGSITQSDGPVPFSWEQEGDVIQLVIDDEVVAEATQEDDELTFRPGDFSGDDAVTFTRQD